MKKFYFLMAALMLSISSAFASEKILYQMNYESATSPADCGWESPSYPAGMSIASDEYGKFFSFYLGTQNGRQVKQTWGAGIYDGATLGNNTYKLHMEFCPQILPTNQYNTQIAIFSDVAAPTNGDLAAESALFCMNQIQRADYDAEGKVTTNYENASDMQFAMYGDQNNLVLLNAGVWYLLDLNVNVETREVTYELTTIEGSKVTSGSQAIAEGLSMYAQGINMKLSRYQTTVYVDNTLISTEVEGDIANDPTIALTGIGVDEDGNLNLNCRKYTITFMEGEILNVSLPDGTTQEVPYGDCDGNYEVYVTTSGTLSAYTAAGSAISNTITAEVDATPCVLPAATATIQSVKEGYAKQYKLTVDNSSVPLSPVLLISYKFTGEDGTSLEAEDQSNGTVLDLPGKGTLELTTACFGYQATSVTVENDKEFKLKAKYDIANMEPSYFTEKGFEAQEDLNSSATSGEGNWTARKGMFYYDEATGVDDGEGNMTYTAVYPYGFVAADNTENVIHRYRLLSSKLHEQESTLIEGLTFNWGSTKTVTAEDGTESTVWSGFNMQWKQGIGIIVNTMKKGDAEDGDGMAKAGTVPVQVDNLDPTDFVCVRKIGNYGRDMAHPVLANGPVPANGYDLFELANIREVWTPTDGIVTFDLYRIDTALAGIEVFADASADGIKAINNSEKVQNNYIYNLAGQKVGANFKGIIIKNGSKFIVK